MVTVVVNIQIGKFFTDLKVCPITEFFDSKLEDLDSSYPLILGNIGSEDPLVDSCYQNISFCVLDEFEGRADFCGFFSFFAVHVHVGDDGLVYLSGLETANPLRSSQFLLLFFAIWVHVLIGKSK